LKPKTKKDGGLDKEILNTFKKVEINIPLLDVVRQIPKYAKFHKELCPYKRRVMEKEVVNMGSFTTHVHYLFVHNMPFMWA